MSLSYTDNGTTTTYIGRTAFSENSQPQIFEAQHGLDTLQRTFIGAAPYLASFIAGLVKGSTYTYNGASFYLIDWSPNGDPLYPVVTLNYLGLSNGVPPPVGDDDFSIQTVDITAVLTLENPDDPNHGEVDVTLTRTISYVANQTTWRYVTLSRPNSIQVGTVGVPGDPRILRSVIRAESESETYNRTYAGNNAPAAFVTATTPVVGNALLGLTSEQIYGTPFFNVTETIARMFLT